MSIFQFCFSLLLGNTLYINTYLQIYLHSDVKKNVVVQWNKSEICVHVHKCIKYRVYPSNKQKQNWKIDTSLVAIGAQNLFFSLYKLGVNFLWIREILKMYISPSFSNRKKVQYYRFCIFKGVSKLDLLHSTGHKSLKNGSKSNNLGSLIKFRKFLAR